MNSRWWESYLVRYFIGALVGCVVLALLAHAVLRGEAWYDDWIKMVRAHMGTGRAIEIPQVGIAVFGLAGVCYCYIASAPITVFHACRMLSRGDPFGIAPTPMWSWWLLAGLVLLVLDVLGAPSAGHGGILAMAGWLAVPAAYAMLSQIAKVAQLVADQPSERRVGTPRFGALLGLLGLAAHRKAAQRPADTAGAPLGSPPAACADVPTGQFERFYENLSKERAPDSPAEDYRASYTHLREHSNSVFIVLLEISFGALLWLLMRSQSDVMGRVGVAVVMVAVWLAPNVYLWGQANRLERTLHDGRIKPKRPGGRAV